VSELHVVFIDELTVLDPEMTLTFGRTGDITVDEANKYMHRVVGTFFHQDNVWWLTNNSKHGHLTHVGGNGALSRLPPASVTALTQREGVVRFEAGPSTYELGWARPGDQPAIVPPAAGVDLEASSAEATTQFGVVRLNEEQRLLLTALAERRLVDSTADANDLPSNASVAHRLGWSGKKLDRKLDYLCARLDSEGVRGLRGEKGGEAVDRRSRLVEHVIESGMIRQRDLDLLPGNG
jgi:hypothetical protein